MGLYGMGVSSTSVTSRVLPSLPTMYTRPLPPPIADRLSGNRRFEKAGYCLVGFFGCAAFFAFVLVDEDRLMGALKALGSPHELAFVVLQLKDESRQTTKFVWPVRQRQFGAEPCRIVPSGEIALCQPTFVAEDVACSVGNETPVDCGHDVGVMQDSDSQWEPVFHVGRLILGRKENLVRPRGAVGIAISIGSLVHIGGHERVVVTNYVAEILDIAATYEQCAYIVESVLHPG